LKSDDESSNTSGLSNVPGVSTLPRTYSVGQKEILTDYPAPNDSVINLVPGSVDRETRVDGVLLND